VSNVIWNVLKVAGPEIDPGHLEDDFFVILASGKGVFVVLSPADVTELCLSCKLSSVVLL
jgi:hypothetical protein